MTESESCCTSQPIPSSPDSNPFKTWQDVVGADSQSSETIIPVNNNPNEEGNSLLPNGDMYHTEMDSQLTESEMQQRTKDLRKHLRLDLADSNSDSNSSLPPPKSSWLLRLFESKLFDMSIAIAYLFNSKEPGVLTYLGNKLFVSIVKISIVRSKWIEVTYNNPVFISQFSYSASCCCNI